MTSFSTMLPQGTAGHAKRTCVLLFLFLTMLFLPIGHASAQSNGVTWERYDVALDVQANGDVHVTERQIVRFDGRFSSGFANIPMTNLNYIENLQISIANGANETPQDAEYLRASRYDKVPGTYTYAQSGGTLEVDYAFDPTTSRGSESRLIVLEYDVVGALRVYEDIDPANQQLWWTAISSDVTEIAPIQEATVTVTLPESVGEQYVASPDKPTVSGNSFTWTKANMGSGSDFEIRLQFPPITTATAQDWQTRDDQVRKDREDAQQRSDIAGTFLFAAGALLLFGGGASIYGLWYTRGRDPQVGPVAEYLTEPPDDLRPGAAGTLMDEITQPRDVISSVLDLARRDVIHMDDKDEEAGAKAVNFILQKPTEKVTPSEQTLLDAMFGRGAEVGKSVSMTDVQRTFATDAEEIHNGYYDELVSHDYFKVSPETTRRRWRSAVWIIPVITAAVIILVLVLTGGATGWVVFPIFVGAVLAIVALNLSKAMPRKTLEGAESAAKWHAFKKYLTDIEKYEKLDESKGIFDKYLPYAVAFGLESSWVAKFARVDTPMPGWYEGGWSGGGGSGGYSRSGGNVIIIGNSPFGGSGSGGRNSNDGGGGGGGGLPGMQDVSDSAGRSLQGGSDGFLGMLENVAKAFGEGGGKGGGWGGGGGWSGGGGGGGFSGGGGSGGSSGGGSRGFG